MKMVTFHLFSHDLVLLVILLIHENSGQESEGQGSLQEAGGDSGTPNLGQVGVHYAFSTIHLTYLAKAEKGVYEALGQYEEALLERLDTIRSYRIDYETSVLPSMSNIHPATVSDDWNTATYLVSHPLLLYRMMHRYSVTLRQFYDDVTKNLEFDMMNSMETMRGGYLWPSQEDLGDVATGIFRLQDTYDIEPYQFAEGNLNGIQTSVGVTARQAVDLAEMALSMEDSLTAGEWLKAAQHKLNTYEDDSMHIDDFTQPWENAVRVHGKTWNIDDFNSVGDIFDMSRRLLRREYEESKWNLSYVNRHQNFKALCRGEIPPQKKTNVKENKCFLLRKSDPYYLINPQLVEIHSVDPAILEIHSFFSDGLIQDVSDVVFNPLMVASEHNSAKETSFLQSKTTAPAWIFDQIPSLIVAFKKLEKIIQHPIVHHPSQEKVKEEGIAEPFIYVQSFSVGSHIEPCLQCEDEIPNVGGKLGGRLATAEFILDDTEAGGDTVFPQLGLKIGPNKGSVLLFQDEGNISQDFRRLRGSCPVLLGQKWVASKFIYERDQCLPQGIKYTI